MDRRRGIAAVACLALLALSAGCARNASTPTPRADPARSEASSTPTPNDEPPWARADVQRYLAAPDVYASAVRAALTSPRPSERGDNEAFIRLPDEYAELSKHAAVWHAVGYDGNPDLLYFDSGGSDYPVADGLIYSTSPTTPPVYNTGYSDVTDSVLSTPTPVAPHWWVAAWDPLLFYNGISYDGRDYAAMGTSMQADPGKLPGPTSTISGRSVGGVTYDDESDVDINLVDVGCDKPVPVLTNPFTKMHKQKTPGLFVYRVRRAVLPGGREIAFALEAWE